MPRRKPEVMPASERRVALTAIARDPEAAPRDRIAAIRLLDELDDGNTSASAFDELDNVAQIRRK